MANNTEAQRWSGGTGYDWRTGSTPSAPKPPNAPFSYDPKGQPPKPSPDIPGLRQVRPGIYTTRPSNAQGTVYMGPATAIFGDSSPRPLVVDESTALEYYGQLPREMQDALTAASKSIGGRTGNSMWTKMVEAAIRETSRGGTQVSPVEMFRRLYPEFATSVGFFTAQPGSGPAAYLLGQPGEYPSSTATYSGGGGYGGGGTAQSINLFSPDSARSLLMQTMQAALGRDPSSDEVSAFTDALNEAQKVSPVTVTASGATTTRSGGMEPDLFALDWVRSQDEYKSVQGTNYYRALIGALTGG